MINLIKPKVAFPRTNLWLFSSPRFSTVGTKLRRKLFPARTYFTESTQVSSYDAKLLASCTQALSNKSQSNTLSVTTAFLGGCLLVERRVRPP